MGGGRHHSLIEEEKFFFSLLRSGLWDVPVDYEPDGDIDWKEIFRMSFKQTVLPLVAHGIGYCQGTKPSEEESDEFVDIVIFTEKKNLKANSRIEYLFTLLSGQGIKAYLVKGQGVARTYIHPEYRQCGDIDLFLPGDNYNRAKELLIPLSDEVAEEGKDNLHLGMGFGDEEVELHGSMRTNTDRQLDRRLDSWSNLSLDLPSPEWKMNGVDIPLLPYNMDAIYLFAHFFHHYMVGGIGLRQICDWARYLFYYRDFIDRDRLVNDINTLNLTKGWKVFASVAVDYLGLPKECMPLYDDRLHSKASKVIKFVNEGGNFGKYGNDKYRDETYWIRKCHSFLLRIKTTWYHFSVFPKNTARNFYGFIYIGIRAIFQDLFSKNDNRK